MRTSQDSPVPGLTPQEEAELLALARASLRFAVAGGSPPELRTDKPALQAPGMAFVTLKLAGRLRGCVGNLGGRVPLIEVVADCAAAAATRDDRFPPVAAEELDDLELSISLIGGFRDLTHPDQIEIGRHGLFIERGASRGLLLPQVAEELGLDRLEFLDLVCRKAGLPKESWRSGCRLQIFTAKEIPAEPR